MANPQISRDALKEALKEALVETLREERHLIRGVLADVLEELALVDAIEEGRKTEKVDRQSVFEILEGAA